MEKWICKKCGKERFEKPQKNETCKCKGRYQRYKQCKCGNWFIDDSSGRKYCSTECSYGEKRNRPVTLVCDYCGKKYICYVGNIKGKRHYCSKDCFISGTRVDKVKRNCKFCGKPFEVYASSLESSNSSGNYCSKECYAKSMRKDTASYAGFERAKKKYFKKKNFCAICGTTQKIQIHHIIPNRLTQEQTKENLIPLCAKHHRIVEEFTKQYLEEESIEEVRTFMQTFLRISQYLTLNKIRSVYEQRNCHSSG